jgi:hypothetical protein
MYFLTYISKAKTDSIDLKAILREAITKNSRNGLTGLLLFRSRTFFQLLEGEKRDVLATFQKIAKDTRHEKIEVLFEVEIAGAIRIFPAWQMGLISEPLPAPELEALAASLQSIVLSEKPEKEKILDLLQRFSATAPPPSSAREILAQSASPAKAGT